MAPHRAKITDGAATVKCWCFMSSMMAWHRGPRLALSPVRGGP